MPLLNAMTFIITTIKIYQESKLYKTFLMMNTTCKITYKSIEKMLFYFLFAIINI